MTILPRVLVVDDLIGQPAQGDVELRRQLYCRRLGLRHEESGALSSNDVASAAICSGQRLDGARWVNSLDVVTEAFRKGWPSTAGRWWSAVLVDMKFGDDDRFGLQVIEAIHAVDPEVPVIVVSSLDQFQMREGETLRIACERVHAEDFLAAPGVEDDSLPPEYRASPQNLATRLFEIGLIPDLEQEVVGESLVICRVLRAIRQLVPSDFVGEILLLGEAGSGKTHLAGYVRREIARRRGVSPDRIVLKPVPLSRAGLDHQKLTLFGTVGAANVKAVPGAFEVADRGVVFLDEIGELHPEAQGDLLPVLQPQRTPEGERFRLVLRMGATLAFHSHAFVVAATYRDVDELVVQDQFSAPLRQRFARKEVRVPSLRERVSDLPALVKHFLQTACRDHGIKSPPELAVAESAWMQYAEGHGVRELGNLIAIAVQAHRRKTLLTERDIFSARDVGLTRTQHRRMVKEAEPEEPVSAPGGDAESSVDQLVAAIEAWQPAANSQARESRGALAKIDRAIGRAKLRLLRDLLEKQARFTPGRSLDLKAAVRILLGQDRVAPTKSGDVAAQIFKAAEVEKRPDDEFLGNAWDKRRNPRGREQPSEDDSSE